MKFYVQAFGEKITITNKMLNNNIRTVSSFSEIPSLRRWMDGFVVFEVMFKNRILIKS